MFAPITRSLFVIAALALPFSAQATLHILNAQLTAAQEVQTPAVASPAVGIAVLTVDDVTNNFDLTLTGVGLTTAVVAAHFHKGAVGVNGPIVRDLGIPGSVSQSNGFAFNAFYLNQGLGGGLTLADLLSGNIYVNVHTTLYPAGEIRGQFASLTPIPEPGTWGLVTAGLLMIAGSAVRRRS